MLPFAENTFLEKKKTSSAPPPDTAMGDPESNVYVL
jgi:hypothetical protein